MHLPPFNRKAKTGLIGLGKLPTSTSQKNGSTDIDLTSFLKEEISFVEISLANKIFFPIHLQLF